MSNLVLPTGYGAQLEKSTNVDCQTIKEQLEVEKLSAAAAELEANKGWKSAEGKKVQATGYTVIFTKYPRNPYRKYKSSTGLILDVDSYHMNEAGEMEQDVKQGTGLWWYELIINIVAVVVLIGLGAVLPGIRRREEEYGIAFDKSQWIWMGIIIIGSIILDVWLGSTKIPARITMIIVEAIAALIITWIVGRRKPANATK